MRKSCFNADAQMRRGVAALFRRMALFVLCMSAFSVLATDETDGVSSTVRVGTLQELQNALDDENVSTIIVTKTIELTDGTYLSANSRADGRSRKIVQVKSPFLPDTGKVTLKANNGTYNEILSPEAGTYSTYNLFDIQENSRVVISNITLMGGFEGSRIVDGDSASTGGIDNKGHLTMYEVDITRTGTALLNQPGAKAVLVDCNIVRNANWYGGGILNFAEAYSYGGGTAYRNGGVLVMDRCSLTENESLGPTHGGGAAENQGYMYLNNCIVANNASTEIGGGINNCKGGDLYVMNCSFTGNITTSDDYGVTAGGAIGNAGGAGNVYIANSILAHNGYDTGEYVNNSSLGRYEGASYEHYCHVANTVIDATAGMDRLDATNITVNVEGLFAGYREDGIVAAGGDPDEDGINRSSDFLHPDVVADPYEGDLPYEYAPKMQSVETNHYVFTMAVDTYFDYSAILSGTGTKPSMGYKSGDQIVMLGNSDGVLLPDEDMLVTVTFNGDSRLPDDDGYQRNVMGAATIAPLKNPETPLKPGVFLVKLGKFTGGQVSGVTVYGDSYISNSVVTVHAMAESAHYLNGWIINDEVVADTAQQYVFSFTVTTNITLTPIFQPVITQIYRARQRYPWNNLVDIDYSVAETNAVKYRLVFLATYEENGKTNTIQLKTFRKNANVDEVQRLGNREDLHRAGDHRVTWDSAADGIELKGKKVHYRALACEGEER